MRTRRSVRNQNILFRALFEPQHETVAIVETKCCFNCANYPEHERNRGECTLHGVVVRGATVDRECFRSRSAMTPNAKVSRDAD
ncbi:MAG TPA: hypothetical protein VJ180_04300 [Pyrinomonadaceae bacterium]|nr:hypothetical protein [Pyrinomonadaceae bacterium]